LKTIVGKYFACGFTHATDVNEIILDGINLIQKIPNWIRVETKNQVIGTYPEGILRSQDYAGKAFSLDVYKVLANNKEIYFGCVEVRMNWYLFFEFSKMDIEKLI